MQKTALITGATKRIGEQTARTLHRAEFNVAIHARSDESTALALSNALNDLRPNSAIVVSGELSDAESIDKILAPVRSTWDRLDVLVNNASIYLESDVDCPDLEQWDEIMNVNLRAPYLLACAALDLLRRSEGLIINITDTYALRPLPEHPVYCASKAGLLGLTKSLAVDLAPTVRVNAVAPGPILWAEKNDPSYKDVVLAKTPLARLGGAEAIADAIEYLTRATFVTGEVIHVDGGRQLHI